MSIAQSLLSEFDHEMANTHKMLERIPEAKLDWSPDPESRSLGRLAGHIAEIPIWGILNTDSLDFSPGGKSIYEPLEVTSRAQLLEAFDRNVALSRDAIEIAPDQVLTRNWQLFFNGSLILSMPRIGVLRTMLMDHIVHHRGQLTVYYRSNGVRVSGMYGPMEYRTMAVTA
jgi:uncharacterized damage-inducible protein DinB